MKKLVSLFCCVVYLQTVAHVPVDMKANTLSPSGEKVLVKALAAYVNREHHKKMPYRKVYITPAEWPWI